jgi:hypothetical protein
MHLFYCPDAHLDSVASATSVLTPLGRVGFEATLGTHTVSREPPSMTYRLKGGGWLACWHEEAFDLELLVCRPILPPSLTQRPEFPLTDCWAAMWRLEAHSPVGPCLFAAAWEPGYSWREGGSNSGEHLYAKTWDDGQTEVSVGTQDEELLAYRAEQGDCLPTAWRDYFCADPRKGDWRTCPYWQHEAHERLRDIGVPTPLPSLETGQRCQIHLVVAWGEYHEQSAVTWLAVDRKAADILNGAGCFGEAVEKSSQT